jgi:uncharacterized protein
VVPLHLVVVVATVGLLARDALDSGWIIDAAVNGNEARFLNHSCDPNCEAVEQDDRIFIEAKRTIRPGEELVYDYSYSRDDVENVRDAERLYVCYCGSPKCRGTILAPAKKKRKKKTAKRAAGKKGAKGGRKRVTTGSKGGAKKGGAKKGGAKKGGVKKGGAKRGRTKRPR